LNNICEQKNKKEQKRKLPETQFLQEIKGEYDEPVA
jgi:hypothetical protein